MTLKGGVTENKCQDDADSLGQLLAEIDKVAGDLAFKNFQDGNLSDEERIFKFIEIFALTINFNQETCHVYKLKMDFIETCSTLYIGKRVLSLNEGLNRLFRLLASIDKPSIFRPVVYLYRRWSVTLSWPVLKIYRSPSIFL